jgi:hypothetical protein
MTMSALNEAIQRWQRAPFPRGSADDALDEIHADLALYDTWVAAPLLLYVDRGVWLPAVPDVLGALDDLTRRVEVLRAAGEEPEIASQYLDYAALLRAAYLAFLEEGLGR